MDWDDYRNKDGSLDLLDILDDIIGNHIVPGFAEAKEFLEAVENIQPIRSRQVASLALATACKIAKGKE